MASPVILKGLKTSKNAFTFRRIWYIWSPRHTGFCWHLARARDSHAPFTKHVHYVGLGSLHCLVSSILAVLAFSPPSSCPTKVVAKCRLTKAGVSLAVWWPPAPHWMSMIVMHHRYHTGWWFGTFFIFIYTVLGIIIPTDSYFSEGLKPPTSIWYHSLFAQISIK